MKRIIFSILFAMMFVANTFAVGTDAIVITSPINYQTIYNPQGMLKVNFRVNATTLFVIPEYVILYINGIEQKKVKVSSTKYFNINGMPEGKYTVMIAAFAHDKRMVAASQEIIFNMNHKGYVVSGR